jgi:hypothetical protein
MGHVGAHGLVGDIERLGDLAVGASIGDEPEHLVLPKAEAGLVAGRGRGDQGTTGARLMNRGPTPTSKKEKAMTEHPYDLEVREGPQPPGTADLGRLAREMMLPKLESLLSG